MKQNHNHGDRIENDDSAATNLDSDVTASSEMRMESESNKKLDSQENMSLVQVVPDLELTAQNPSVSEEKNGESVYKRQGQSDKFHLVAHQIFLDIKNQNQNQRAKNSSLLDRKNSADKEYVNAIFGLIQILLDWIIDIVVAGFHFSIGRYYVGSLTLIFVFLGGAFVTFSLHVLMKRKGHKEFMEELRNINFALPYLIYIPSFLPFFSAGLKIHLLSKLKKTPVTQTEEFERLDRLLKICEEHRVTDLLYESCFEAYPQAILQTLTLIEKPSFTHFADYIPLLGVMSAWVGIGMAPINLAKCLNNVTVKWTEVVAGMANKGVTLLSFALFISASRKHFSSSEEISMGIVNTDLVLSTLFAILGLAIFSELPGIVSFHLELGIRRKMNKNQNPHPEERGQENENPISKQDKKILRIRGDWQIFMNLVSLLIPLTALIFWLVTEHETNGTEKKRFIALCIVFGVGFAVAFLGWLVHKNVPWLGTFSLDILLLLYIGIYSYTHQMEFRHIDFHYDPRQHQLPQKHSNSQKKQQEINTQIKTDEPQKIV